MPNIFPELITMKYNANTIRYVFFPHIHFPDALSYGFIHVVAQIGTYFGSRGKVLGVTLKFKPLPVVRRRLLISFCFNHRDVLH